MEIIKKEIIEKIKIKPKFLGFYYKNKNWLVIEKY